MACFDPKSGQVEEAPAIDPLKKYPLEIENDVISIIWPDELYDLTENCILTKEADQERIIVIGGGAAGFSACQTLRKLKFPGRIDVISSENHLPIDRIKLSKSIDIRLSNIQLKPEEFYRDNYIDIHLGTKVIKLNDGMVYLDNGKVLNYDKLLIASGCEPRRPICNGSLLKNIFALRSLSDAELLNAKLESITQPKIVIIGSSFIGNVFFHF